MKNNPELFTEFGRLYAKMQQDVQFPPARSESRLLPLMPESTVFYAAIPNYGGAAQQALTIFRDELKQSAVLRDWWRTKEMAETGPKLEDALQSFSRLAEYLGDEIVLSAYVEGSAPNVLLVAPIRKPGLKAALQQALADATAKSRTKPGIRFLDVRELAGAEGTKTAQDFVVLVRPDYVVAGSNVAVVRGFNGRLDANSRGFLATGFGQRVARAYQDGITVVTAADLQTIMNQALADKKQERATVQRTGFDQLQYFVWEHTSAGGRDVSQSEVSFTGPKHGIASWLGAPTQLRSLEFAAPSPLMVVSFQLADPSQMFDDLRELTAPNDPQAVNPMAQFEQQLKINLQQDFLRTLGGEMTLEVDSVSEAGAVWKAILSVNDPVRLQQTLTALLAAQQLKPVRFERGGATYYKVSVSSGKTATDYTYAFVDGYLVIASSPEAAIEAVRLHRSGESLAKSPRLLASLPPGYTSGVSALMYQDPMAVAALQMRTLAPGMMPTLSKVSQQTVPPAVMVAYADERSIRSASTSSTMDAGVVLMMAAIAIPNLLRSRTAANEASAVGSLRTVNTAQVMYASTYPDRGFAPSLATLGVRGEPSAEHAGLIDATLGCSGGPWCEKSGYRFNVTAVCMQGQCPQYVSVATPASTSTGSRSFCSTSDGVIRFRLGPPLEGPIRATECKRWQPLQ